MENFLNGILDDIMSIILSHLSFDWLILTCVRGVSRSVLNKLFGRLSSYFAHTTLVWGLSVLVLNPSQWYKISHSCINDIDCLHDRHSCEFSTFNEFLL